ncbi:MAG: YdcF family protein [Elainellaceae cyanobacterium]
MIDPAICPETSAGLWANFTWHSFGWFTNVKFVVTVLLTLAGLSWLVKRPLRHWLRGLSFGLLALYLIAASPALTTLGFQGLTQFLASPKAEDLSAEAIVLLGRGPDLRDARTDAAFALWERQVAPQVFVSGRGDTPPMIQKLRAKGLPAGAVDGEPCSSTTEENAQYTASILQPQGVRRIVLVTDGPHMLRSLLTFRSLGFDAMPYVTPLPETLRQSQTKFLIAREYLGLISYGALGRFSSREVASSPAGLAKSVAASPTINGSGA